MGVPVRVLMVEDLEDDAVLQVRMLRQAGYEVEFERVDSAGGLSQALDKKWDIIISDHSIPHFSGNEALKIVRARDEEVPFIFVSGTVGEDVAIAAMKVGAQDYVMKTNLQRLVRAVQRELREAEERRERKRLELQVMMADPTQVEQVIMNFCLNARDAMAGGGQLIIETKNIEIRE